MVKRKNSKTQNELDTLKKELLHELHLFHIRVSEELKKLSEALSELEGTLDRYHQELRLAMRDAQIKLSTQSTLSRASFIRAVRN